MVPTMVGEWVYQIVFQYYVDCLFMTFGVANYTGVGGQGWLTIRWYNFRVNFNNRRHISTKTKKTTLCLSTFVIMACSRDCWHSCYTNPMPTFVIMACSRDCWDSCYTNPTSTFVIMACTRDCWHCLLLLYKPDVDKDDKNECTDFWRVAYSRLNSRENLLSPHITKQDTYGVRVVSHFLKQVFPDQLEKVLSEAF